MNVYVYCIPYQHIFSFVNVCSCKMYTFSIFEVCFTLGIYVHVCYVLFLHVAKFFIKKILIDKPTNICIRIIMSFSYAIIIVNKCDQVCNFYLNTDNDIKLLYIGNVLALPYSHFVYFLMFIFMASAFFF